MTPYEDLPSMALFARVVQLRSFSAAARQANVAKSAVSKRVAALEARLGVRLLVRTTRNLSLTEDGLRFYEHCAALLAAAEAADDAVRDSSRAPRGPVRINASTPFSEVYLAAALAAFLREYPDITVHLTADNRFVDLAEGGFDLVIRIARELHGAFVARRLASDRMVVVGAPGYLARAGTPQSPDDLIHHNCLHYAMVPLQSEWRFRIGGKIVGVPTRGNLVASDGTILREAALAELGLAVTPRFQVAAELASGRLVSVLDDYLAGELGVYAVMASRTNVPARVRLLVDFLAKRFARDDWAVTTSSRASGAARSAPPTRR
ncbi:MAG TPA: LysR family transcriptional regulator [Kofleriaceae bacterium]|jgi:DNA-binding transcriptional LysR family regulator|nr:LysR family transcriptional regulator [Kofleriaceae bacterium]